MPGKAALKRAPQPTDRDVGRRKRMRRRMLRITQTTLGDAIGVTFQQIQKCEHGTNRVDAGRLQQIADALECRPAWFFETGRARLAPSGSQRSATIPNFRPF